MELTGWRAAGSFSDDALASNTDAAPALADAASDMSAAASCDHATLDRADGGPRVDVDADGVSTTVTTEL